MLVKLRESLSVHRQETAKLQKPFCVPASEAEAIPSAFSALPPPAILTSSTRGGRARRDLGEAEKPCLRKGCKSVTGRAAQGRLPPAPCAGRSVVAAAGLGQHQ